MPIRVLQHNLIYEFEHINPDFLELTKCVIADLSLDTGIGYQIDEEPIKSPFVIFNKITVQEAFLSYVWCISFSLTVLYVEVIVKKSRNDFFGNNAEKIDFVKARDAYRLWEYATSLIYRYSSWNVLLPNPEYYHPKYVELIPKVNALYLVAMKFVLAHEFAHIELEHNSRIDPSIDPEILNKKIEKEADDRAIDLLMKGANKDNITTIKMGALIGLCSLLFFKSTTEERAYPDMDERIDAIIKVVNPEPQDAMWGIATLAYKLWDVLYNKGLNWQPGLKSPMELYQSIKSQIQRS